MNKENVNEVPSYMPVLSGNGFPLTQLQLSAIRFKSMVEIVLLCNLTLRSRLSDLKSTTENHCVNVQQRSILINIFSFICVRQTTNKLQMKLLNL
jgi:hypothetical protein